MYFDVERTLAEVAGARARRRARHDPLQLAAARRSDRRASEALVLAANPAWQGGDWDGAHRRRCRVAPPAAPACGRCSGSTPTCLSRARGWRGRMRACRGVGATLADDRVEAFDAALAHWLAAHVPAEFTVRHRVDAHAARPWPPRPAPTRRDSAEEEGFRPGAD